MSQFDWSIAKDEKKIKIVETMEAPPK